MATVTTNGETGGNATGSGAGNSRVRGRGRGGPRGGGQTRGESSNTNSGQTNGRSGGRSTGDGDSGGGRGRGRGGGRGRGRGRGRGGDSDRAEPPAPHPAMAVTQAQDQTTAQPPPQPGGNGVFGDRLTKDAAKAQGERGDMEEAVEDAVDGIEREICFICADPVRHYSVAPCNHRTCHVCALRERALYKEKRCAYCRTEDSRVIFTNDAEKRFEEYKSTDFIRSDHNLGISFETQEIFDDTIFYLKYNCPDKSCDVQCMGWPDLHRHVRAIHSKVMCDLCSRNRKEFTHEFQMFTHQDLRQHEKVGDDNPGAVDQTGFRGHPECGFCRKRFYGEDELFTHCREKHERCHLCDRRTGGQTPLYFANYDALEQHFGKDHYQCLDPECLEKKFVVFDSAMDLKAHQLSDHPNGFSKDARRDARRVDISTFDYRPQYQEPTRGGRRGGRGRDPNAEGAPAVSGGQMSRAELAYQREREIHSAQSVSSRSFGGQLSRADPVAQVVHRPAQSPRISHAQPAVDAVQQIQARSAETPQEQARRLRHAAVNERASNLLRNDGTKLAEFRERVSTYTRNGIDASDLIDAFFALFDTASDELGKLVKELADIFEVPGKREDLLAAWSNWKAINEDYPSLPGPEGPEGSGSSAATIPGANPRALKLKLKSSTTAQSSGSAAQRHASWGSAAGAAGARPSNAFPALPIRSTPAPRAAPAPTPSWLAVRASGSTSASASSSARASPAPSRMQSSANLSRAGDAFPSLPAARKPTSSIYSPGYTGSGIIKSNHNPAPVSAWGGSAGASGSANGVQNGVEEGAPAGNGGGKKGNKGKKQMLFQWG